MGPEIGFGIDFRPSDLVTIGPRLSYQYLNLWINDNEWLGPAGHERRDLHTFFFTCYIHFNVI